MNEKFFLALFYDGLKNRSDTINRIMNRKECQS